MIHILFNIKNNLNVFRLELVEITGKRNRKVPVLLIEDMIHVVDTLIATRSQAGVATSKKYLFAAPTSPFGYLKRWDALN